MYHILIVEDDLALAQGLCRALSSKEILTEYRGTLREARAYLKENVCTMVLLDVNLPDGSGFDFLKEIKETGNVQVILLTVNDLETDIVTGLELGAEDYITKPFSLAVLRARVNAQLRRLENGNSGLKAVIDDYIFDFHQMEFYVKKEKVELSKQEQRLLKLLVENRGITLSREVLIDRLWTDGAEYVDENALSVCIKRLRDKISGENYIKTIYGIGYVWRE